MLLIGQLEKQFVFFYGPTPISNSEDILPAFPVNIIGKTLSPDKSILRYADGKKFCLVL